MNVRYRILHESGKQFFCNLKEDEILLIPEIKSESKKYLSGSLRAGVAENDAYKIYAFTRQKDYLKSSSKFKIEINLLLNAAYKIHQIIDESSKEKNVSTKRLIHNLTSINAHNIQEFYSLIPQENVSRKMGKQVVYVTSVVKEEPREAAMVLLRMAKNNAAMKVEFSVFKKLFDSKPEISPTNHNVHKVLMNVFYLFFPDFTDKNVNVVVGDKDEHYSAYFDYESLHVALYHIVENAAKYVKPYSTMNVRIRNYPDKSEVIFEMVSTQIRLDEIDSIFEEGISGDLAKRTGKSGEGIGMSRARKIVELNGGKLTVIPYIDSAEETMGIIFQKNVFSMLLPRKSKR